MIWIGFTIGLFVGCFIGVTIMGLLNASKYPELEE